MGFLRCNFWARTGGTSYIFSRARKNRDGECSLKCWKVSNQSMIMRHGIQIRASRKSISLKILTDHKKRRRSIAMWTRLKQKHFSALGLKTQSTWQQWVIKSPRFFSTDFNNQRVVSRLFEFSDWVEIKEMLQMYFHSKVLINLLFAENDLIDLDQGPLDELMKQPENGRSLMPFTWSLKNGIR